MVVSPADTQPTLPPLLSCRDAAAACTSSAARSAGLKAGGGGREGCCGASLLPSLGEMDQDYERRLLRQINHQNLPAEARLSKVGHHWLG